MREHRILFKCENRGGANWGDCKEQWIDESETSLCPACGSKGQEIGIVKRSPKRQGKDDTIMIRNKR